VWFLFHAEAILEETGAGHSSEDTGSNMVGNHESVELTMARVPI